MTSADCRLLLAVPILGLAAACGGASSPKEAAGGPNVVPITVNGASCSANAYFNEPCVSVKVCVPGSSSCRTIDHLLLDTGSVGLRIFSQALAGLDLPAVASGGGTLAECVGFLDGSAQWGPIVRASIVLGGEPAVTVPIQQIDSTFSAASRPQNCSGAQIDPTSAGFDGILGVQGFPEDCGDGCNQPANNVYFSCTGSGCTSVATPVDAQVTNPVAALPLDGNGVVVSLPAVPASGAGSVSGQLILGIGTRTNNQPSGVKAFPLDDKGQLQTTIGSATSASFLDTGSNGYFFSTAPDPALTSCTDPNLSSWFCPASPVTVSATNAGASGSPTGTVTFQIASIASLPNNVAVSSAVGGIAPGAGVDYGLPFHFGRNVFLVMWGRSGGSLGPGPAVAY